METGYIDLREVQDNIRDYRHMLELAQVLYRKVEYKHQSKRKAVLALIISELILFAVTVVYIVFLAKLVPEPAKWILLPVLIVANVVLLAVVMIRFLNLQKVDAVDLSTTMSRDIIMKMEPGKRDMILKNKLSFSKTSDVITDYTRTLEKELDNLNRIQMEASSMAGVSLQMSEEGKINEKMMDSQQAEFLNEIRKERERIGKSPEAQQIPQKSAWAEPGATEPNGTNRIDNYMRIVGKDKDMTRMGLEGAPEQYDALYDRTAAYEARQRAMEEEAKRAAVYINSYEATAMDDTFAVYSVKKRKYKDMIYGMDKLVKDSEVRRKDRLHNILFNGLFAVICLAVILVLVMLVVKMYTDAQTDEELMASLVVIVEFGVMLFAFAGLFYFTLNIVSNFKGFLGIPQEELKLWMNSEVVSEMNPKVRRYMNRKIISYDSLEVIAADYIAVLEYRIKLLDRQMKYN